LECGEVPPAKLLDVWRKAMNKEFDLMQKGFNIAAEYTNMSPAERAKYDA
jgi:hypothetical protein